MTNICVYREKYTAPLTELNLIILETTLLLHYLYLIIKFNVYVKCKTLIVVRQEKMLILLFRQIKNC